MFALFYAYFPTVEFKPIAFAGAKNLRVVREIQQFKLVAFFNNYIGDFYWN